MRNAIDGERVSPAKGATAIRSGAAAGAGPSSETNSLALAKLLTERKASSSEATRHGVMPHAAPPRSLVHMLNNK